MVATATTAGVLAAKVAANEDIRREQDALGLDREARLPFLCECTDVRCRAIVRRTAAEYAAARADGRDVLADGHPR